MISVDEVWRIQVTITSAANANESMTIRRRISNAGIPNRYVAYKESKLTSGQGRGLPTLPCDVDVEILREQQYPV